MRVPINNSQLLPVISGIKNVQTNQLITFGDFRNIQLSSEKSRFLLEEITRVTVSDRINPNRCNTAKTHAIRWVQRASWFSDGDFGLTSSLSDVERRSDALFHRYSEPPAQITATFETGSKLEIFLGEDLQVHAQGFDTDGHIITSSKMAKNSGFPTIAILPQISPLKDRETVLRKPYVEQCMESHLASRHFRNQLRYFHQHYEKFCEAFGRTWPELIFGHLIPQMQRGKNRCS